MKKRFILFACITISLALVSVTLSTCENPQVIGLLRFPSELDFLHVNTFADDMQLVGGASLEPGLRSDLYEYNVIVAKDTTRFAIDAGFNGKGTVKGLDEGDLEEGTEFYFYTDIKVITLTVQKEWMKSTQYRLIVMREDPVPVAEDVDVIVEPGIGAFFIGSGVIPTLRVTARLPDAGGELSYQWYMNTSNDTRGGYMINEATGVTHTMKANETHTERTVYYYVEVTNTIDGNTGLVVSPPRAVSFLNKYELDVKSLAMMDIPAGNVPVNNIQWLTSYGAWNTPGYKMGKYPVTWDLWKKVFDYAEKSDPEKDGYSFSRTGNQGAEHNTTYEPKPVGNMLHPVTMISWRDAVVWCNAYSEMDGLQPVYRDSSGKVLKESRAPVEAMIDISQMSGKNGYRLPSVQEWVFAARGANPGNSPPWTYETPGYSAANQLDENHKHSWGLYLQSSGVSDITTGEVGKMLPNQIWNGSSYVDGLYDLNGMVFEWIFYPENNGTGQYQMMTWAYGADCFDQTNSIDNGTPTTPGDAYGYGDWAMGFRLARDKD